jgi:hypothetical protein
MSDERKICSSFTSCSSLQFLPSLPRIPRRAFEMAIGRRKHGRTVRSGLIGYSGTKLERNSKNSKNDSRDWRDFATLPNDRAQRLLAKFPPRPPEHGGSSPRCQPARQSAGACGPPCHPARQNVGAIGKVLRSLKIFKAQDLRLNRIVFANFSPSLVNGCQE